MKGGGGLDRRSLFTALFRQIKCSHVQPLLHPVYCTRSVQLQQLLLLNTSSADTNRYAAIDKWSSQLVSLQRTVFAKLN